MRTYRYSLLVVGLIVVIGSCSAADGTGRPLLMDETVRIALDQDLSIKEQLNMMEAYQQKAKADKKLPDPTISFGLNNFPTDTFERAQEPMTQITVSVMQPLPKGKTLQLKSAKSRIMASRHHNGSTVKSLHTVRSARHLWLEMRYWIIAEKIVRRNKGYLVRALKITQDQYRTGKRGQQDVLRAELEIDLLNDRLLKIKTMQGRVRAALTKWIGMKNAYRPLDMRMPALRPVPSDALLRGNLKQHPLIISQQLNVDIKNKEVDLAKEAFKPQFAIRASYGERENRPDFASVGLAVKVPLSRRKYHYQLRSAHQQANAALVARDNFYRQLVKMYEDKRVSWKMLLQRYSRYKRVLLPRARANSKTTLLAYRNGRTDFNTLIRSRVTELDIELKALRVHTDAVKSHVDLLYFVGEVK